VAALDGGYVRNWEDRRSNFELIVGRSVPEDRAPRYLGLVHGYDLLGLLARRQDRPFASIEEALLLRELVQGLGLSQHDIAHRSGRDVSWVSRRLHLLSGLPDAALAAVRAARLSSWAASRVIAPRAGANTEHAERLLAALATAALSTRELQCWFAHYQQAPRSARERMIDRPRLFIDTLQASTARTAGARLRAGPEGECIGDLRCLEAVIARLRKRVAALHPLPAPLIAAAPRLRTAIDALTRELEREDTHDPGRDLRHRGGAAGGGRRRGAPQGGRRRGAPRCAACKCRGTACARSAACWRCRATPRGGSCVSRPAMRAASRRHATRRRWCG
jgi:hypothetical protein